MTALHCTHFGAAMQKPNRKSHVKILVARDRERVHAFVHHVRSPNAMRAIRI
jgi:hypothetical protein